MYCKRCGAPNKDNNNFCVNCGERLNQLQVQKNSGVPVSYDKQIDLAYYQANLRMQQQALFLQQQQLTQQQREFASMAKCPRCGSTSLSGNKKGYGIGKGVAGLLAGSLIAWPVGLFGLTAGNIGAKKVIVTCMRCGKKFKV